MRRPKGSGGSSCRPRRETDRPFQLTAGGETAPGRAARYCELAAAETHIYIFLLTQRFVHCGVAAWDGAWLHLIVSRFPLIVAALAILQALRARKVSAVRSLSVAGTPGKGFQGGFRVSKSPRFVGRSVQTDVAAT